MKKLLSVILLLSSFSYSQVGIGTTTPQEQLHVIGKTRVSSLSSISTSNVLADQNGTLFSQKRIMGKIRSNGNAYKIVGANCIRTSTGRYQITFNEPLQNKHYIILLSKKTLNGTTYDDPNITYYDQQTTGFRVEIENNDNGTQRGVAVNLEFMFKVEEF